MTHDERTRLRARIASDEPLVWVLTGDSITHGIVHTHGARSYSEHLHELVRGDLDRTRDVLINTGVSGHRIVDIHADWEHRVARWRPDVVTLMIGTNDCAPDADGHRLPLADFAAGIHHFVDRVRAADAIPVLQTPPSVDTANAATRAGIAEYVAAVRAVARAADVLLADHHERFRVLGEGDVPWRLMGDPFHPNDLGHAAIAHELAETLGLPLTGSRTRARLSGLVG